MRSKNDIFFQVNHFSQDFYNNKIGSEDNWFRGAHIGSKPYFLLCIPLISETSDVFKLGD